MFQKEQLSIMDWFLFFVLMVIPIVNVICFIWILCSRNTNKTLRNYLGFQVVVVLVTIVIFIAFYASIMAFLEPYLENLPGYYY